MGLGRAQGRPLVPLLCLVQGLGYPPLDFVLLEGVSLSRWSSLPSVAAPWVATVGGPMVRGELGYGQARCRTRAQVTNAISVR